MSRLPSPPLPSLLLPLLLLSLLASCLHQKGNCEAAAVVPRVTDGVPTPTEDCPRRRDLPTPTEDLPSEDDDVPVSVRTWWAVCGAGQYSLLGHCHRQRGANRLCLSDSWCRSGRCRLGLCRRGTADCRSGRPACGTGQQCVSEPDGWRCRAEDGTLALGAACSLDRECASGTCSAEGTCVCPADFTACDGHCCSAPTGNPSDVETVVVCQDGFTKCGEHCYRAVKTGGSYMVAEQICGDMGAIMATPRTAAENTCAKDVAYAASTYNYFWLGYRFNNIAGSFVGADSEGAMSFANWNGPGGEPHLDVADNCVDLYAGNGLWHDYGCQYTRYVLCQM